MIKLLLLAAALASCAPAGYYVANVYADDHGMYTERCPIDSGTHGDKPDPDHCRYERVGPPPPQVASQFGPPPAPPAPPAPAAPPAP